MSGQPTPLEVAAHDAQRSWSAAAQSTFDEFASDIGCIGPALDIGAGTGMYSRVLAAAGLRPVAVDLREGVLRSLRERAPTMWSVVADGAHLPFADRRFPTVFIANVLHLDSTWRMLLDEAARVCASTLVLVTRESSTSRTHALLRQSLLRRLGAETMPTGLRTLTELEGETTRLGYSFEAAVTIAQDAAGTADEALQALAMNPFAWAESCSLTQRAAAAADVRTDDEFARVDWFAMQRYQKRITMQAWKLAPQTEIRQ